MTLSGKVNCAYWELENLERKVNATPLTTPQFHTEIRRLKGECHRLHSDAIHVDEFIKTARAKPFNWINDIEKRIYLFRNEVGFVQGQLSRFVQWDKNPPTSTTIFSSPSNSPGSSEGSPPSSGAYSSAQSLSQSSSSFGSQNQSTQSSSSFGSQRQSNQGSQGSQGNTIYSMFHPHNLVQNVRLFYH